MKTPALFREYIWLINTIRRARRISLAEINERWLETELSGGVDFSRATFVRHKNAIEDIFGVIIECDRQNGYKYYIENESVLRENSVQRWMLSTLNVSNIVSESLSLQKRILLESTNTEDLYLQKMIEAMKRNVKIAIKYRKYGDDEPRNLTFEPYCLKMFRQRWYVLGHFHRDVADGPDVDYFGLFAFDRIMNLSLTDEKFVIDPDFDAEAYFSECYGVLVNDDTRSERITIRVFDYEQYYVNDLPIHPSQREVSHGNDYTDYELFLRPTPDFIRHLVGMGNHVQVLSPEWIADEVCQRHYDTLCLYEPEEE